METQNKQSHLTLRPDLCQTGNLSGCGLTLSLFSRHCCKQGASVIKPLHTECLLGSRTHRHTDIWTDTPTHTFMYVISIYISFHYLKIVTLKRQVDISIVQMKKLGFKKKKTKSFVPDHIGRKWQNGNKFTRG